MEKDNVKTVKDAQAYVAELERFYSDAVDLQHLFMSPHSFMSEDETKTLSRVLERNEHIKLSTDMRTFCTLAARYAQQEIQRVQDAINNTNIKI